MSSLTGSSVEVWHTCDVLVEQGICIDHIVKQPLGIAVDY
jgi:hypothetical protein